MLILFLLSIQFAVSYGDFMCMYIEAIRCYMPVAKMKDYDYCTSYEQVLECMKRQSVRCNVENSKEVLDMEQTIMDACQEGSELNKEFLKYKACQSEAMAAASKAPCLADFREATVREIQSLRGLYLEEFKTSDDAKAELIGELSCGYMPGILQCGRETMNKTCGEEAAQFFQRVRSPKEHFMLLACDDSESEFSAAAASFSFRWLLLQMATALFVVKMYNRDVTV